MGRGNRPEWEKFVGRAAGGVAGALLTIETPYDDGVWFSGTLSHTNTQVARHTPRQIGSTASDSRQR